jgi:hypothetical protein
MVRRDQYGCQELTIASGNESNKNREMAGNTISLVRGSDRTSAAAVKELKDTNSGMVPQNIVPNACMGEIPRISRSPPCEKFTCTCDA